MKEEKFNYCVGRPWNSCEEVTKALCIYCYRMQVNYGTKEEAEEFKKYVEGQTKEKQFIYILQKLEDEESGG